MRREVVVAPQTDGIVLDKLGFYLLILVMSIDG